MNRTSLVPSATNPKKKKSNNYKPQKPWIQGEQRRNHPLEQSIWQRLISSSKQTKIKKTYSWNKIPPCLHSANNSSVLVKDSHVKFCRLLDYLTSVRRWSWTVLARMLSWQAKWWFKVLPSMGHWRRRRWPDGYVGVTNQKGCCDLKFVRLELYYQSAPTSGFLKSVSGQDLIHHLVRKGFHYWCTVWLPSLLGHCFNIFDALILEKFY